MAIDEFRKAGKLIIRSSWAARSARRNPSSVPFKNTFSRPVSSKSKPGPAPGAARPGRARGRGRSTDGSPVQ